MVHRHPHGARPRILVVDGYASGRASICASLVELGYEVIGAPTAAAARALVAELPIDLIVADADDRALCELAHELDARPAPIPWLWLTTYAAVRAAAVAGAPLLEKPTHLSMLASAVAASLARGPPARPSTADA